MKGFTFDGTVPASKSELARLLIARSYCPDLVVEGSAGADDVRHLTQALEALGTGVPLDCGASATGFRLLALRASRLPGVHRLRGTPQLLQRPHAPLAALLRTLGAQVRVTATEWILESGGWRCPSEALDPDGSFSSQFHSAVVANGWCLPFPLTLASAPAVSAGYFSLTVAVAERLGMCIDRRGEQLRLREGQQVQVPSARAAPDLSSAFAVAALAAVAGEARFRNLSLEDVEASLQPDRRFVSLLQAMGVDFHDDADGKGAYLQVRSGRALRAVDADLRASPDLFPVLAALAGTAVGRSRLAGAPHLVVKESNRIAKVAELLELCGVAVERAPDGLLVAGRPERWRGGRFDPEEDHRLVLAASVLREAGAPIEIDHAAVVGKSFPEFLSLLPRDEGPSVDI